jgi:hypothetical protein
MNKKKRKCELLPQSMPMDPNEHARAFYFFLVALFAGCAIKAKP